MSFLSGSFHSARGASVAAASLLIFAGPAAGQTGGAMTLPYEEPAPQVMLQTRTIAAQCIEGPNIPRQMVGVVADSIVGPFGMTDGAAAENGPLPSNITNAIGVAWQDTVRNAGYGTISAVPEGRLSPLGPAMRGAFARGLQAQDDGFRTMLPDGTDLAIEGTAVFRLNGCPDTLPPGIRDGISALTSPFDVETQGRSVPLRDRGPLIDASWQGGERFRNDPF